MTTEADGFSEPDPAERAALGAALAGRYVLGAAIGLSPAPGSVCDAESPSGYLAEDGTFVCRCIVCPRCNQHTGNSHQGHYWRACKVLAERLRAELAPGETVSTKEWFRRTSREDFHFCCGNEFGCELEAQQ